MLGQLEYQKQVLNEGKRVSSIIRWNEQLLVVKDTCELWVSESLGPLVGHWLNWPSCGIFKARWAQVWMVVELSGEGAQQVTWQAASSFQRWPFQFYRVEFFQSSFKPFDVFCCPQRNDLSPSDVSGQQSLDLRSLHSSVVPFVRKVVLFPWCTNLCIPGCTEQHKQSIAVYVVSNYITAQNDVHTCSWARSSGCKY